MAVNKNTARAGARIRTLVVNIVSFLFILGYCMLYRREKYHLGRIDRRSLNFGLFLEIIRLGLPVGLEYLLWNGSNLRLIRFVNY